jgi:hypothetical protein
MWCSTCRTDVSVRTTGHAGGLLCSQCGHDLLAAAKPTDAIRQAREILERWNSSDLFERISSTESLDSLQTRLDKNKKPAPRSSSLTKSLDLSPPENVVAEVGPRIPLTILKDPLTAEDLASISPKYYRESDETTTPTQDAETAENTLTAENAASNVAAPDEHTDSSSAHEVTDELLNETEHNVDSGSINSEEVSSEAVVSADVNSDVDGANDVRTEDFTSDLSLLSDNSEISNASFDTQEEQRAPAREVILNAATDTGAPVTIAGITSELQRVYELALAQEAKLEAERLSGMAHATGHCLPDTGEDYSAQEIDSPTAELEPFTAELAASAEPLTFVDDATAADSTQTEEPIYPTIMDIREESALSPTKPAEPANVNELPSSAMPTKMTRSPMRRPLLHRRFQMERPATTSSTGSDIVNRKLRVDQPGGTNDAPATAQQAADFIASSVAPETKIVSNAAKPGRRIRIDAAESVDSVTGTDGRRARTQTLPKHRYIDDAHDSSLRGPHFEIAAPRRSNLTSATGQFLAYLGVLGLTVGTAMVIYGHFGGYSEYTPTGWLVTTVAQMLLFLGVINLVSGGIEQNNEDVSRRINTLGEQLIRIEQVTTDVLRGPKLSPRLYDDPNAEAEVSSRETANVQRD